MSHQEDQPLARALDWTAIALTAAVFFALIMACLGLTGCPAAKESPTYPADRYDDMHPEETKLRKDVKRLVQIVADLEVARDELAKKNAALESELALKQATPDDRLEPEQPGTIMIPNETTFGTVGPIVISSEDETVVGVTNPDGSWRDQEAERNRVYEREPIVTFTPDPKPYQKYRIDPETGTVTMIGEDE